MIFLKSILSMLIDSLIDTKHLKKIFAEKLIGLICLAAGGGFLIVLVYNVLAYYLGGVASSLILTGLFFLIGIIVYSSTVKINKNTAVSSAETLKNISSQVFEQVYSKVMSEKKLLRALMVISGIAFIVRKIVHRKQ